MELTVNYGVDKLLHFRFEMAKTNDKEIEKRRKQKREAERRRRERIKSNPELYEKAKAEERARYHRRKKQGKIKSINEESKRTKRIIRKRWRTAANKYRKSKKIMKAAVEFAEQNSPPASPIPQDQIFNPTPATSRRDSGRKIVKRNRSKMYRDIQKLRLELQKTRNQLEKYKKRFYRTKNKKDKEKELSPRSRVLKSLEGCNVPENIKEKLLFSEALNAQISKNLQDVRSVRRRKTYGKLVNGSIMKKYRLVGKLKDFASYKILRTSNRKKVAHINSKNLKKAIQEFYLRDECSRIAPGKADTVTCKSVKKQKRYLNFSVKQLHKNFIKLNNIKVSYSQFCANRPFWVLVPKTSLRETCLCLKHENFRLLFIKMKLLKMHDYNQPDDLIKSLCCDDKMEETCLERKCVNCLNKKITWNEINRNESGAYKKWILVSEELIIKGIKKTCKKYIKKDVICKKEDMIQALEHDLPKYSQHIANIKHQYHFVDNLKDSLEQQEVLIHMDFSENYQCKYNREIQSAHFGGAKPQISLHTVVWYYKSENGEIVKKSFCSLSENTRHDPIGILVHLQPLFQKILDTFITLKKVHFLSDGPTTQYRNRNMFFIFATKFVDILKPSIMTWSFTEAGHGKGAPDGIGGVIKRTADQLVAFGEDVADLKSLVEKVSDHCPGIELHVIAEDSFEKTEDECIIPNGIKPFKGTMLIHQVTWTANKSNTILFRRLSCLNCRPSEICSHYHLGKMDMPLRSEKLRYFDLYSSSSDESSSVERRQDTMADFKMHDFVIVKYSNSFFPGEIREIKNSDVMVSCMEKYGRLCTSWKWPSSEDCLWYKFGDIVTKIDPPKLKTRNIYSVPDMAEYLD